MNRIVWRLVLMVEFALFQVAVSFRRRVVEPEMRIIALGC